MAARIEEGPFDVDDYVERGDIIVQFRDRPAVADLKQAEAAEQETLRGGPHEATKKLGDLTLPKKYVIEATFE